MTSTATQDEVTSPSDTAVQFLRELFRTADRPGPFELVRRARAVIGAEASWQLPSALAFLTRDSDVRTADRDYCRSLAESDQVIGALRGTENEPPDITSTIDTLIAQGRAYRSSAAFQEMVTFMGCFRDYAPYNNMLVKLQNPSCGFYATERDWRDRFKRRLIEDARPMLILAPMHPVMLVYDLDQTDGEPIPDHLLRFAQFAGDFRQDWLDRSVTNAAKYKIGVTFKGLSSTHAGFATHARASGDRKMRIVVHDGLDGASRFGVLAHELAHVLLGHLGSDFDNWWPARANLSHHAMEVEAEAVAYIVGQRFGLSGSSPSYVSGHLVDDSIPPGVSLELIAKTAGLIERFAKESSLPAPRSRPVRKPGTRP